MGCAIKNHGSRQDIGLPYWIDRSLTEQDLTMMLPSRLGCPLSLKTPDMAGIPGKALARLGSGYGIDFPICLDYVPESE